MIYSDSFCRSELPDAYLACFPPRETRLVGRARAVDSGYFSILRFFGEAPPDPDAVRVAVTPGWFAFSDQLVARYAAHFADRLTAEGRLYEGPAVAGFRSLDLEGLAGVLTIQQTSYRDFAGSLFGIDEPYPAFDRYGGTLRHYYLSEYGRAPHDERPLANCLGVCGHLLIEEAGRRSLLQVKRAGRLATLADTQGPTAAGSVDFRPDYQSAADILIRALGQEVREELLLSDGEFEIVPLAFAREIFRPDNPQLFGLITTSLPAAAVLDRLQSIPEAEREFSEFRLLSLDASGRLPASAVEPLNFEARMSYYLLEEYLEFVQ